MYAKLILLSSRSTQCLARHAGWLVTQGRTLRLPTSSSTDPSSVTVCPTILSFSSLSSILLVHTWNLLRLPGCEVRRHHRIDLTGIFGTTVNDSSVTFASAPVYQLRHTICGIEKQQYICTTTIYLARLIS